MFDVVPPPLDVLPLPLDVLPLPLDVLPLSLDVLASGLSVCSPLLLHYILRSILLVSMRHWALKEVLHSQWQVADYAQ